MPSLLSTLPHPEPDAILKIMAEFQADPRPDKVDLGVGVYRNAAGHTPVMEAVRLAEGRLLESQSTKGYVALSGDPGFRAAIAELVFGTAEGSASAATPGGTGAVRQGLELARLSRPRAKVWISDPTWPNHATILQAMGWPASTYRYYDAATGGVDLAGMVESLSGAAPGDVVVLHGCCHNPTGADLSDGDWAVIAQVCVERDLLPFVDLAYLGFGDGVEADANGPRLLAKACPEMLLAFSGSKSFGLYRERVGALFVVSADAGERRVASATLDSLNRHAYAFPPDHGARAVTEILTSDLRRVWMDELEAMRLRLTANRVALAQALRAEAHSDRFAYLAAHRGMFSRLPAAPAHVAALRAEHGIYVIDDGRINLAGLTETSIPRVAQAIAQVCV